MTAAEPDQDETGAVLNALADQRWHFRSVAGLAKSTGLTDERVELILDRMGDAVRRPLATDGTDRELYALAARRPRSHERYLALRQRVAIW